MLINFSVENFLSFKGRTNLSLSGSSIKEHPHHVFSVAEDRYNLLNGVMIYGANGSGKSNLITAMSFMRDFVINSSKDRQAKEQIGIEIFKLSTETSRKPSVFEIEILIDATKYRYGFSLTKDKVLSEWLYHSTKIKEYELFRRDCSDQEGNDIFSISDLFKKTDTADPSLTRKNALFLSVCSQFNGNISIDIIEWFQSATFVSGTNYTEYIDYTAELINSQKSKNHVKDLLKKAKLGFSDVEVERKELTEDMLSGLPKDFKKFILESNKDVMNIKTVHSKRDHLGRVVEEVKFDLMTEESLGSQKFFALVGPIYKSLRDGSLLIIDELDARLHVNLCRLIINFYRLTENNPKKSQFIFTTHNTHFLNRKLFRRDQLYLIDKSDSEASVLYNIHSLSNVRNDASFEKEYLEGKYGGVPFDQQEDHPLGIWDLIDD